MAKILPIDLSMSFVLEKCNDSPLYKLSEVIRGKILRLIVAADESTVTNASQICTLSKSFTLDVLSALDFGSYSHIISWLYTASNERQLCFHRYQDVCHSFEGGNSMCFSC